ncbi:putative haloacid dehalogenase [Diplodia seriata]|uniref:Putative haloacid dehalogenase n=1 Tax=Diplodia seriata TaxID=420778 RepID=A0A0G2HEW3_9PEZI|nr:putative haloacid dehalogenase [Diplodia seriata]
MPNPKPSQKNLLIAFDAFGTLFTPRAPIGALYGEVARKHGICNDVSDEEIMGSFKKGYRDGYMLYDDVIPLFASLRAARTHSRSSNPTTTTTTKHRKIVTAVLTNSDDRVAGILRSFGLRVGHTDPKVVEEVAVASAKAGQEQAIATPPPPPTTTVMMLKNEDMEALGENDIDFVLTSYDCGYEKPHRAIFDAARRLAAARYAGDGAGEVGKETGREDDVGEWEAVYVGDEVDKDVVGAENAGWELAFLVDREGLVRDAGGVVRRHDVGGEGEQEVRVLRDLRELERYVLG